MAALNELIVAGQRLLLVEAEGKAVHLVRPGGDVGPNRRALPEHWFDDLRDLSPEDQRALRRLHWSPTTLCRRKWTFMAAGDLGPLYHFDRVAKVPTCRRCISVAEKQLPPAPADDRVDLVASRVVDVLRTEGVARVLGVPADQMGILRKAIRVAIRTELGFASNTFPFAGGLEVVCDEAFEPHRPRWIGDAFATLEYKIRGESVEPDTSTWIVDWAAPGVD